MYKRDFGILLLSVCALYLSLQHEGAYQFRKAWYHRFSDHEPGIHELEEHPPVVPPPLVTDLNGDGKPEILTATPTGKLQLLAPRRFGDGFAKAELLSQVELDPTGRMRVAALRSGFLTPPPKELVRAPRKQVVVVVTTELRVLCLNHNLQKVWEQDLSDHFAAHGGIREVAVHISDQRVSQGDGLDKDGDGLEDSGDRGIVVVGASVTPLTLAQREVLENELEDEIREELLARFRAHGRRGGAADQEKGDEVLEEGRHFSYFGFEGVTGAMRWMHEARDFHRDLGALQDELVQQHAYHMAAEEVESRHYGEASCREYRASVLAVLPHSWHHPRDTRLVPMHFEKGRAGAGSNKAGLSKMGALKAKQGATGAAGEDAAKAAAAAAAHGGSVDVQGKASAAAKAGAQGAAKGGAVGTLVSAVVKGATGSGPRGARRQKQRLPPNVVVAHLEEGIEAIHLFSGRTVCRLHLPTPGLHVDLNGDGVPEHVVAVGGDPEDVLELGDTGHRRATFCFASVKAGIPARLPLWNGTVCRPFYHRYAGQEDEAPIQVAPPIFLPQPGKHGNYRGGLAQKGMAVFLNSLGDMTAYDSEGSMLFQMSIGTNWDPNDDEDQPGGMPTLRPMPLRPGAVPTVILAAGDYVATVVTEHGREVDTWDLPDQPAMPLQMADFNFDGYTDILLVSQDGLWGWAQVRHPGALPFSALVAALMVIMAAVFVTQQGFMQPGGGAGGKRRPLRSTERED